MCCLGGKGVEKGERESDKERILKSMLVQSGKNVPFLSIFYFEIVFI